MGPAKEIKEGDVVYIRSGLDPWMYEHLKEHWGYNGGPERFVVAKVYGHYGTQQSFDLLSQEEYRPYPWYKKKLFCRNDWVVKDEFLTAARRANMARHRWRRWLKQKYYLAFRMGT